MFSRDPALKANQKMKFTMCIFYVFIFHLSICCLENGDKLPTKVVVVNVEIKTKAKLTFNVWKLFCWKDHLNFQLSDRDLSNNQTQLGKTSVRNCWCVCVREGVIIKVRVFLFALRNDCLKLFFCCSPYAASND